MGLVSLLLLGWGTSRAQTEPLQAGPAGETLVLSFTGAAARLEFPDGHTLTIPLPEKSEVSSLAALEDGWAAVGSFQDKNGNRRLFAFAGDRSKARALPEPPEQVGKDRRGAVLFTDGGKLAGIAWLEGDGPRSLAVRAAGWNGRKWQAPARVSEPGPGSQLALAGAVLKDGSWLLAWAAFDGRDDEIVWSRRIEGEWSPVQPLSVDNQVPDITPAVTAVGNGALISWSRYGDGSYWLRLARFSGGAWRDERQVGDRGSLYPSFATDGGRAALLYLKASQPRAWSVLEIDAAGRVRAQASVPSALDRPVMNLEKTGDVRLRWPGRAGEAVAPLSPLEKTQ
jgi:hypothetical protein